tara:strand:+ start:302 stop:481 length:180 start_codon:yes stop_codon:yes gene_type:complete
MELGLAKAELTDRIKAVCAANGMTTGVHIRLMVAGGIKSTPYQHPRLTISGPIIVIIPE